MTEEKSEARKMQRKWYLIKKNLRSNTKWGQFRLIERSRIKERKLRKIDSHEDL